MPYPDESFVPRRTATVRLGRELSPIEMEALRVRAAVAAVDYDGDARALRFCRRAETSLAMAVAVLDAVDAIPGLRVLGIDFGEADDRSG